MDYENRAINVLKRLKLIKLTEKALNVKDAINNKVEIFNEIENLKNHINYTNKIFEEEIKKPIDSILNKLDKEFKKGKYKGIVIYPLAVNWNPVQRPHHILRKLGEQGYLCFFCEHDGKEEFLINEKYKNVYLVNHQEKLLPFVRNKKTIVLMTYFLQYLYAKFIPNKILWMDVLDRLDFMSSYNDYSKPIWNEAIENALIVTYSADNLKEYLSKRNDAILLENAVNVEDFSLNNIKLPADLKNVIKSDKKIIGYYGAVEEWFDFNLIKKLDEHYNVIIIGNVNPSLDIKKYKFKNVHFLGAKKFEELKNYAYYFDVAMIPFKISEMTDCVSPVKFFEYMALNKPVITTNIKEMRKYASGIVKIVDEHNIVENIELLLQIKQDKIIKECEKIANDNTWKKRVEKIIDLI